ncbi:unnamed protein product [Malus baccata var. baccata]
MAANSRFPAETLDDIVRYYRNTCSMLPSLQKDHSLLGEDEFAYDSDWVKNQIQGCLEFWLGKFCQYSSVCPARSAESADYTNTPS